MTFCKRPLKGNPVFPPGFFNANDVSFCVGMVNSTEFGIWAELRSRGIFSPNYLGFLVVLVQGGRKRGGRRGSQGYTNISSIISLDLKPSSPQTLKPWNPQTIKPSNSQAPSPQTHKPQALKPLT